MGSGAPDVLVDHAREWQTLAEIDPLWAILTTPDRRHNRWDLESFFETGVREVEQLEPLLKAIGRPRGRKAMLDFGCGVGRLTRAFASSFEECVGVDISETMIERARELNADVAGCEFLLNGHPDLRSLGDDRFDLVYTTLVLQHLPDRATIHGYLSELVRVLRPGGLLMFQLPCFIPWRHRLRPRRRVYRLLRRCGVPDGFLHGKLNLTPMRETFVPIDETVGWLQAAGATLLAMERRSVATTAKSATYYATKGP